MRKACTFGILHFLYFFLLVLPLPAHATLSLDHPVELKSENRIESSELGRLLCETAFPSGKYDSSCSWTFPSRLSAYNVEPEEICVMLGCRFYGEAARCACATGPLGGEKVWRNGNGKWVYYNYYSPVFEASSLRSEPVPRNNYVYDYKLRWIYLQIDDENLNNPKWRLLSGGEATRREFTTRYNAGDRWANLFLKAAKSGIPTFSGGGFSAWIGYYTEVFYGPSHKSGSAAFWSYSKCEGDNCRFVLNFLEWPESGTMPPYRSVVLNGWTLFSMKNVFSMFRVKDVTESGASYYSALSVNVGNWNDRWTQRTFCYWNGRARVADIRAISRGFPQPFAIFYNPEEHEYVLFFSKTLWVQNKQSYSSCSVCLQSNAFSTTRCVPKGKSGSYVLINEVHLKFDASEKQVESTRQFYREYFGYGYKAPTPELLAAAALSFVTQNPGFTGLIRTYPNGDIEFWFLKDENGKLYAINKKELFNQRYGLCGTIFYVSLFNENSKRFEPVGAFGIGRPASDTRTDCHVETTFSLLKNYAAIYLNMWRRKSVFLGNRWTWVRVPQYETAIIVPVDKMIEYASFPQSNLENYYERGRWQRSMDTIMQNLSNKLNGYLSMASQNLIGTTDEPSESFKVAVLYKEHSRSGTGYYTSLLLSARINRVHLSVGEKTADNTRSYYRLCLKDYYSACRSFRAYPATYTLPFISFTSIEQAEASFKDGLPGIVSVDRAISENGVKFLKNDSPIYYTRDRYTRRWYYQCAGRRFSPYRKPTAQQCLAFH